jgi:hypothetical protein
LTNLAGENTLSQGKGIIGVPPSFHVSLPKWLTYLIFKEYMIFSTTVFGDVLSRCYIDGRIENW